MIVRQQDRGAAVSRGVDDDCPQRKVDATRIAPMARDVEAAGFIVEVRDPETLAIGTLFGEAGGKEFARRPKAIELQREFGTLTPHGLRCSGWFGLERREPRRNWGQVHPLRTKMRNHARLTPELRKRRITPSQGPK